MITLYQLAGTWGIPNLSHFCAKLETYLVPERKLINVI